MAYDCTAINAITGALTCRRLARRAFAARFTQPQPGSLRARIFLVGKRLYQVMAIGTADFANGDAATAFLDSFTVTE